MRNLLLASIAMTGCMVAAYGQAPLAFEVASIKPAPPQMDGRLSVRMSQDPGRLTYTNVTLRLVIAQAYKVKNFQITGPGWLDSERYDISAKLPEGAKKDDVPEMLRTLLRERFQMEIHKEQKLAPVYALVVGKNGVKAKPAEPGKALVNTGDPSPATANSRPPRGGVRMNMGPKGRKMNGDISFAQVAEFLSNTLDRPVVDETNLTGDYTINLEWTPDASENLGRMGMPRMRVPPSSAEKSSESEGPDAPGIFTAVQEQLGLRLEPKKSQLETIVVDKAEKIPTEN